MQRPIAHFGFVFALVSMWGCSHNDASPSRRERAAVTTPAAATSCPVRPNERRLGADTVLGLVSTRTLAALAQECPAAREDTVGVGGTTAAALRFDAPGLTVWAIQSKHDPYGDSLHRAEAPDLWALQGDSLRFPDGELIPNRVGALRALDSIGVVMIDHGDDGTGSHLIRCRYPALAFIIDNRWLADVRVHTIPLARVSVADTTKIWRIEIQPGQLDPAVKRGCGGAGIT